VYPSIVRRTPSSIPLTTPDNEFRSLYPKAPSCRLMLLEFITIVRPLGQTSISLWLITLHSSILERSRRIQARKIFGRLAKGCIRPFQRRYVLLVFPFTIDLSSLPIMLTLSSTGARACIGRKLVYINIPLSLCY
jgi:hypothetical protein